MSDYSHGWEGVNLSLCKPHGPEQPCRYCKCKQGYLISGTPVHVAGVRCSGCNRHIGWLSKARFEQIKATEEAL